MNLILITIDCLRADHLGCLGYSKKTTPNLDNLASAGALFTQAISVGPETPTSFKAMFTSTYPLMHGGQLYTTNTTITLAQVLREHDYHTAAFHSNPWISSLFGYDKGFDTFGDGIQKWRVESRLTRLKELVKRAIERTGRLYESIFEMYTALITIYLISKAEVLNKKAASWLSDNPNNFFLWIHYMDVHEPYLPASGYASALKSYRVLKLHRKARYSPGSLSPQEVNKLIDLYDTNLGYVDQAIDSLLCTLKRSNILDDTFVVITADHGQQLLERGGHGHGNRLYEELIRVPLIIAGPGLKAQVISQQISLLDLAPTILDILKIEKPRAFLGNSLLPLMKGNKAKAANSAAISETDTIGRPLTASVARKPRLDANHRRISLRTGKWKYIYTEGRQDELYDLEGDPKETKNIIDVKPEIAAELRTRIMAHIKFEEKSAPSEQELIKVKIRKLKGSGRI